ncbi:olfactory receptor 11A1-like [Eucyclogobius newberryi]|uniref:olfactory receptor 11A1-like n=1 Tax=Eucyclogobius newberryi TaxID=166745 RepID=UPI003B5BA515
MHSEANVTIVTLSGYVEVEKYKFVYFFTLLLVYIVIVCSNGTIVCLIWMHQNLHEPMYVFIAALLCNSILFSTVIYPKMLINVLSEKPTITISACLAQCFFYYSFSTSEFVLLAVMAYDRYVSICKPLQYPTVMRKNRVICLLVFAWLIPTAQVALPVILNIETKLCNFTLKGIYCNNLIYTLHCTTSRAMSVYGVVVLINVTILPVFFILFTYIKIFVITYRSCKEVRKKAAETCLLHLFVLINFSCLLTYDVVTVKLDFDVPKTVRLVMTLQVVLYHPLVNPIIYGLKMKEISKHLRGLFTKGNAKIIVQ